MESKISWSDEDKGHDAMILIIYDTYSLSELEKRCEVGLIAKNEREPRSAQECEEEMKNCCSSSSWMTQADEKIGLLQDAGILKLNENI